jgi:CO/xanthine dehydrogenase FAD-binding subunit
LKLPPFGYHAPESLDEALELLHEHGDEAKVLAGGQSLVPLLVLRLAHPSVLIDLGRVPGLATIAMTDGTVAVGAMVRAHDAEHSELLRERVPLLAEAIPLIGHLAIRSRGTVGGSLAHADPAAELPAVAVALDAQLVVTSAARGPRTIAAADFFQGFLTTALADDEALVSVRLPAAMPGTGVCFEEASRRHGDFAMVGSAASLRLEDGRIAGARIALIGVAETPLRRLEAEAGLAGAVASDEAFRAAGHAAATDLEPHSDLHGTRAYRTHLASVLTRRALERAAQRAGATP